MSIIDNSYDTQVRELSVYADLFFTMISLGNIGSHDMPDTEEASTWKGKMKKNQKYNRVYTTLIAYSGANETQGRFFKGVKGTLRPGAILINADFSFFLSFSNLNSNFPNFSRKKKVFQKSYYLFPSYLLRVFSSLIFRCRVISVYF